MAYTTGIPKEPLIIMRFLILNTDYPEFLRWLYAQHPGLESRSYEEQMWVRVESLVGGIIPLSFKHCCSRRGAGKCLGLV